MEPLRQELLNCKRRFLCLWHRLPFPVFILLVKIILVVSKIVKIIVVVVSIIPVSQEGLHFAPEFPFIHGKVF